MPTHIGNRSLLEPAASEGSGSGEVIRVLLADDYPLLRAGTRSTLERDRHVGIRGVTNKPDDTLEAVGERRVRGVRDRACEQPGRPGERGAIPGYRRPESPRRLLPAEER